MNCYLGFLLMLYFPRIEMTLIGKVDWRWISGYDGTDSIGVFDGTIGEDERTSNNDRKLHFLDQFLSGWTAFRSAILLLPVIPPLPILAVSDYQVERYVRQQRIVRDVYNSIIYSTLYK